MKIGIIIQARMGSTRLNGKVLKLICGKSVLAHVIERVKKSGVEDIVIATTTLEEDDLIEREALVNGAKVFRGSENDVLSRYYYAAKENKLDAIVRITSDCPLIDANVISDMVAFFVSNDFDLLTNAGADLSQRTYPRGLDTEIFSYKLLEAAHKNANEKYQREHVTPYLYENNYNIYYYKNNMDYSEHRWTLDTTEDYLLISKIYEALYLGEHDFFLEDIVKVFCDNETLFRINAHIEQKNVSGE